MNALEITAKKYNLSVNELKTLREQCMICGAKENIVVDHNHKTGKVRGGLCGTCNRGLGHFDDDIDLLKRAVEYLEAYDPYRAIQSRGDVGSSRNTCSGYTHVVGSANHQQVSTSILDRASRLDGPETTEPNWEDEAPQHPEDKNAPNCSDSSWGV